MTFEYLEFKRAIEATKEQIENAESVVRVSRIALRAFEEEIKNWPAPKEKPEDKMRLNKPK